MTLRCKPGDLAIVVRSLAGNEGKIVRCIRFLGDVKFINGDVLPSWEIDGSLIGNRGLPTSKVPDCFLHPIRPPAQDQSTETTKELEAA